MGCWGSTVGPTWDGILWGMQMSRNHECKTIKGMFNYIFYWCGILIGCQLTATLDNTSNNVTTCKTMEDLHYQERLQPWNGSENQLLSRSHIFTNPAGQYIEVFNKLQIECGVTEPLKILLHSNVQWGTTTFLMLNKQVTQTSQTMSLYLLHSFFLADFPCQPIGLFVSSADLMYGPISTIASMATYQAHTMGHIHHH